VTGLMVGPTGTAVPYSDRGSQNLVQAALPEPGMAGFVQQVTLTASQSDSAAGRITHCRLPKLS